MTRDERALRRRVQYHLRKAMRAAVGRPMQWGRDDCALFHGDVHLAATGFDPCAAYRGRYRTMRGAHRVLGRGGLPKTLRAVARRQGWHRVRAVDARIGDVGLVPVGRAVAVVVCVRRGEWVGRNEAGFSIVPSAAVRVAWTIC